MKLLTTVLLLALHGAHASHKVTKRALDAETTHRLAAEAATAGVVKLPGAVAKLFGQAEGADRAASAPRNGGCRVHPLLHRRGRELRGASMSLFLL